MLVGVFVVGVLTKKCECVDERRVVGIFVLSLYAAMIRGIDRPQ